MTATVHRLTHMLGTALGDVAFDYETTREPDPRWGHGEALFSADRQYRYALVRSWDLSKSLATFIMLNPSTADAFKVDPTVTRCLTRALATGHGGLLVLNAFALRSTDPRALYDHEHPVGPLNNLVINRLLLMRQIRAEITREDPGHLYVGWGEHGVLNHRDQRMHRLLAPHAPLCLAVNKSGMPKHPLYCKGDAVPFPYPGCEQPLSPCTLGLSGSSDPAAGVTP